MSAPERVVVVGAGLAGAKAAEALRAEGFGGQVTILGDEIHRPYDRPPLSKDYLQGKADQETVFVHPAGWYDEHEVTLRTSMPVNGIDRSAREVLSGSERIRYDRLLLATGSTPRRLQIPGADLDGVLYLRRIEDTERIRAAFGEASRIAIIGAGWIGLEVAAAARAAGLAVTVCEQAALPLLRVLGSQLAEVFADLHRENGVDLRLGVEIAEITGGPDSGGAATGVRLTDGTSIPADLVLVGVGIRPNDELARSAGLSVDNGIIVDQHLATEDPLIFAAGDVANAYHPFLNRHLRVEHWDNAKHQPVVAAQSMLGISASYERLPYFYTDQYDLGMEYVGSVDLQREHQVVVRGDLSTREFVVLWLRDQQVQAGMNVNVWGVADAVRELITSRQRIDPQRAADPTNELTALLG